MNQGSSRLYRGGSRMIDKPRGGGGGVGLGGVSGVGGGGGRHHGLTQQKKQEIKEAFELFDTDGSGFFLSILTIPHFILFIIIIIIFHVIISFSYLDDVV